MSYLRSFLPNKPGLQVRRPQSDKEENGKNIITMGKKNTTLHRLREAVINPFNMILLVIAVITYFTDVAASSKPGLSHCHNHYLSGVPVKHGCLCAGPVFQCCGREIVKNDF